MPALSQVIAPLVLGCAPTINSFLCHCANGVQMMKWKCQLSNYLNFLLKGKNANFKLSTIFKFNRSSFLVKMILNGKNSFNWIEQIFSDSKFWVDHFQASKQCDFWQEKWQICHNLCHGQYGEWNVIFLESLSNFDRNHLKLWVKC